MFSHDSPLSISAVYENGALLLQLTGELDLATAPLLHQTVTELVSPDLRVLTLDVADLAFVDLVGLRALLDARLAALAVNAEFRLLSVSNFALRVIRLAEHRDLELAIEPPVLGTSAA